MSVSVPSPSQVADAFRKCANNLTDLEARYIADKNWLAADQTDRAQRDFEFAATQLDAEDAIRALTEVSAAAGKDLGAITQNIEKRTKELAQDEANLARLVGIATAGLQFVGALLTHNPAAAIKAIQGLVGLLNGTPLAPGVGL